MSSLLVLRLGVVFGPDRLPYFAIGCNILASMQYPTPPVFGVYHTSRLKSIFSATETT